MAFLHVKIFQKIYKLNTRKFIIMITFEEYTKKIISGNIKIHNMIINNMELMPWLSFIVTEDGYHDYILDIKDKFKFILTINNANIRLQYLLENLPDIIMDTFGYIATKITVEKDNIQTTYNFDKKYSSNKYDKLIITFECKIDNKYYTNDLDIPDKAYYLIKSKHHDYIIKNGLEDYDIKHFINKELIVDLYYDEFGYLNDNNITTDGNYNLYEISLDENNIIFQDKKYNYKFFTYDYIFSNQIKLIKENI